jgi:hypothetical protein
MPASAPIAFARSSFSSLDDVTITFAPIFFANRSANVWTPLPTPVISTTSSFVHRPRDTSARYAVTPASGIAAASSSLSESGAGCTLPDGTAMYSANVPWCGMPSTCAVRCHTR